jgi:hypothetical protein
MDSPEVEDPEQAEARLPRRDQGSLELLQAPLSEGRWRLATERDE